MKVATGYEGKRPRIEMIALIDVVFLLLVFFIYAMLSMSVERGLPVLLPRTGGTRQAESLVITLDGGNRIYLGERRILPGDLPRLLAEQDEDLPVLIRGDAGADLGAALELLAVLRDLGREAVSFQVEEKP